MNPANPVNLGLIIAAMLALVCPRCLGQGVPAGVTPTDAQVDLAIRRGLDYLISRQDANGNIDTRYKDQFPGGAEALVATAAISAGVSPDDKSIRQVVEAALKANPQTIYARSMRTLLLSRLDQKDFGGKLADDVNFLVRLQNVSGGWGYGLGHPMTHDQPRWTDNSNSQLALLALSEASAVGAKVPTTSWKTSLAYWLRSQNKDGGWGYETSTGTAPPVRKTSYGSMTAAGVASMLTLDRRLSAMDPAAARGADDAIFKGTRWLGDNYSVSGIPRWSWGLSDIYNDYYFIYVHAMARSAQAAGLRSIGTNGLWRANLANFLVGRQQPDGSWLDPTPGVNMEAAKDAPIRTSFAVMTLADVRRGPLVSRIAIASGNDYDAANIAEHVSRTLGWQVGWQSLSPQQADFITEAPIAYITGPSGLWSRQAGIISPEMAAAIRQYVLAGGVVLVNPMGDKAAQAAAEYLSSLLPEFKAGVLADDHPVYSLAVPIPAAGRVKITGLSDSTRTAVFILDRDLSGVWQADQPAPAFDLAVNIAAYATDGQCPKDIFARMRPAAGKPQPAARQIEVARLKGGGEWNICPTAMAKLDEVLNNSLSLGVKEVVPVDLSADVPESVSVLWITGSSLPGLDASQKQRLKKFVAGGGTVFIDPSAGQKDFFEAASLVVKDVFGQQSLKALPTNDPFITGEFSDAGADLSKVAYSPAVAKSQPGLKNAVLYGVLAGPRWGVIISPYAVTCPLSGVRAYGIQAYSQPDARRLAANVILYAAGR